MSLLIPVLVIIFATLIGSIGALYLKKSANNFNLTLDGTIKNKNLLIGVLFYGLSSVFFIITLKFGPLSILYPVVATSYIWVALLSAKFLNERINLFKLLGILFIILGVVLIA